CANGKLDGSETDVDCGGSQCVKCDMGRICKSETDCATGVCDFGSSDGGAADGAAGAQGRCKAPSCSDSVQNGTETDSDCGGPSATRAERASAHSSARH